jgi:4-hydroxy-tetrahydrodipicolinate reductase
MRILLIGHGRMGRLVEGLAAAHGCEVAGIVTSTSGLEAFQSEAHVAIDFTVGPAVRPNLVRLAERRLSVVIGTTGWAADELACREIASKAGIGVLAAPNFAVGMHVFRTIVEHAARMFAAQPDVGAWIHELHHAAKKDAPSGTALLLQQAMAGRGYTRPIGVSSTRAGSIPGTHVVGFDGPAETVTLTHEVRDRAVFAHGALAGAKWLNARRGWFTMTDLVGE